MLPYRTPQQYNPFSPQVMQIIQQQQAAQAAGQAAGQGGGAIGGALQGGGSLAGLESIAGMFGGGGGAATAGVDVGGAMLPSFGAEAGASSMGAGLPGMATLGPAAAVAASLYQGYDAFNSAKGKSGKQALKDSNKNPLTWLTPATSGLGSIWGSDDSTKNKLGNTAFVLGTGGLGAPLLGFQGGKHKDQVARDGIRKNLRGTLTDDNYRMDLGEGQTFDIGKDGSSRGYNVKAGAEDQIGYANPLSAIITGGDEKLGSDFAGYFSNAFETSKDPRASALKQYEKLGLDQRKAYDAINKLNISDDLKRAYHNGINETFGNGGFDASGRTAPRPNQPAASTPAPAPTPMPRTIEGMANLAKGNLLRNVKPDPGVDYASIQQLVPGKDLSKASIQPAMKRKLY